MSSWIWHSSWWVLVTRDWPGPWSLLPVCEPSSLRSLTLTGIREINQWKTLSPQQHYIYSALRMQCMHTIWPQAPGGFVFTQLAEVNISVPSLVVLFAIFVLLNCRNSCSGDSVFHAVNKNHSVNTNHPVNTSHHIQSHFVALFITVIVKPVHPRFGSYSCL